MKLNKQRGFTLVEILMVLILIAVLAAVAINAFINFRAEARDAALRSNLAALRSALSAQYAQMQLRCDTAPGTFPAVLSITANDITDGNSTCVAGDITVVSERKFVQGAIPDNPWSSPLINTVSACVGAATGCTVGDGTGCGGVAATYGDTWCYNPATGEIWADALAYEAW